ncbi:SDR family NAD(P)-dependent oxidoreductase [Sphingomonas jatrophae]|uniref:NADP-dependent 3-hydroxy acid dehydrogenase YdfG n=1 Tax=Sphingomonas jatrophae TaxID=1166337 RepID=A0A1I6KI93_9SPHN|nr:SDR family oxidoreductase [Sphingomonas jatrophae]SFR90947.1 NADP-dependent 3-hydroxy acid dehydrogenase YdfG [Sphingomonas jatrophae]
MRFEGKSAIVTGAASGIGRAVAVRLAREGARVVIGDRNAEGLAETAAMIGEAAQAQPFDVADPAACAQIVAATVERHGRLDVLCNIAGVLDMAPVADFTVERWQRMIGVNLGGVFFMSQAALPHLVETRGCIVNMASAAGLVGVPYNAGYVASKHGVVGLTKAMALEFCNTGVRINAVCPGGVNTPLIAAPSAPGVDWAQVMRSAGWLNEGAKAEPEDIADTVAFLASKEARMITGIAMPVDGGQTAG